MNVVSRLSFHSHPSMYISHYLASVLLDFKRRHPRIPTWVLFLVRTTRLLRVLESKFEKERSEIDVHAWSAHGCGSGSHGNGLHLRYTFCLDRVSISLATEGVMRVWSRLPYHLLPELEWKVGLLEPFDGMVCKRLGSPIAVGPIAARGKSPCTNPERVGFLVNSGGSEISEIYQRKMEMCVRGSRARAFVVQMKRFETCRLDRDIHACSSRILDPGSAVDSESVSIGDYPG